MINSFFTNLQAITFEKLKEAKNSVFIAVAWINFDDYFSIFQELLCKKVKVQIIINWDFNNERYINQINALNRAGAIIHLIKLAGIMHHKFCIIDERISLFGSYNWTRNAERRNTEDLNVCDESKIAYKYLQEFFSIIELSNSDFKKLRSPDLCKVCWRPNVDILVVEPEGYDQSKVQVLTYCGCGYRENPETVEYLGFHEYANYSIILEKYNDQLKEDIDNSYGCHEEIKAEMYFEVERYFSKVRKNRFDRKIIHAVAIPAISLSRENEGERIYTIVWKERGMENIIPDLIPFSDYA